jgi:bifunctional DNA-binding transcriptional regulator/antitoxin component of YhaV-PrlF toxin-antitoxin module
MASLIRSVNSHIRYDTSALWYTRLMAMSENLLVEDGGKITLPETVRDRYGLAQDTPLRMIETRHGILLIPLTNEPMSEALRAELEEWQSLGAGSFQMFPYEDERA